MKENKIITAETEYGEADLYDGMIMSALEDIFYLNGLDRDLFEHVYTRVNHYFDVLRYMNDPAGHPEEYLEAKGLEKKFGARYNPGLLIMVLARVEVLLGR